METTHDRHISSDLFHFNRPRLNRLFTEAVKHPLVVVCAGAGYGKTSAVHDFAGKYQAVTVWIQLSERDNVGARFWENFSHAMTQINESFARAISQLGFPDTVDKMSQYLTLVRAYAEKRRIIVMDDFHVIEEPSVIRFVEYAYLNMLPGASLFLISRSAPRINMARLISKGCSFSISESDLLFTESELSQYFRRQEIVLQPDSLREIMRDTEGWAFAVNFIARAYQKAPGYKGYLSSAMKTNIFQIMETEIWNEISEGLRFFLIRLSLIGHLSADLIALMAGENKGLIAELEQQSAYVRRDSYINAYLIHPLFLEFISQKQELLPEDQRRETYAVAGDWCIKNGFKIDALSYFEKIGDYKSIVQMFVALPTQIPYDVAQYAAAVIDRIPQEAFDTVPYLAAMHLRAYMCQGLWQKSIEMADSYEARFRRLPDGSSKDSSKDGANSGHRKSGSTKAAEFPVSDPFKRGALASLYYCRALSRVSMGLIEDRYDFDNDYEKLDKCYSEPIDPRHLIKPCPGPWICVVGSARKGALEEFIAARKRSDACLSHCYIGLETGEADLAQGELLFYKGDVRAAEPFISHGLDKAREKTQFEYAHRALFYVLRIAVLQGDYQKTEQALKSMKAHLDHDGYHNRFINYDISLCWYYCVLGMPEKAPDWLKENFSPYCHAAFIDNFGNQMKARFCYLTKNYTPLLSYIQEMKQRESFLFGRVEMLAMEACVRYKLKENEKAFAVLSEAYQTAAPNGLLMPFLELGKDMRTLTANALKIPNIGIPRPWLEDLNRKAAIYAKHQARIIMEYRDAHNLTDDIVISPRESEILADLALGLSRLEIATNRSLSINTVKMIINNIYKKFGTENLADLIRIAVERKII